MQLSTPIDEAGKLFKMRAGLLEKLGVFTIKDLLFHIPHRYEDFTLISKIGNVQPGETVTVQGVVMEIKNQYTRGKFTIQKAKIQDDTGTLDVSWFNQPFIPKVINVGENVSFSGRIGEFAHHPTMENPEYEVLGENGETLHTGRLVPIYPETRGLSSKWIRRQMKNVLQELDLMIEEYLPQEVMSGNNLQDIKQSLQTIHFPDKLEDVLKARERLAFEELFFLQLTALFRKQQWKTNYKSNQFTIKKYEKEIGKLKASLPFDLTGAQEKALKDIFSDMSSEKPMNRLLEGDVGSGKTVVAAVAIYLAKLNGYQSVLMAPTEILAMQHFKTVNTILNPLGVKVSLVTGSKKLKDEDKDFDVLVGTHAVLSDRISINKLGLVIIDEQQRFGVEQRAIIRNKGKAAHLLTMTATPIPRTVALTMYGNLDLSYLDEMPKGRQKIKTWVVPEEKRNSGYGWIKKELKITNSQAFIICPFIEESENMSTVKAATKEFDRLKKEVFPDMKLGLLHGRMKAKEKDEVLQDFKKKEFDILVATPVVEVGIDIPNAIIIVIEASERFGLSQLHQLRGRVGRGDKQSYCLLFTDSPNMETLKRLKAMETTHNGAELAEFDLQVRGSGDLYGTLQHGRKMLKVASFSDRPLIIKTRQAAEKIFAEIEKYPTLFERVQQLAEKQVSPD